MSTIYASLRLITAAAICQLILHRSKVAAQSSPTPAKASACYATCEASWSALQRNVSSPRAFIAKYENSTRKAVDYYCSSIANISACISSCSESYSMFVYQDRLLSFLTNENFSCFTDEAMCRAKDSKLFCNAYYSASCSDNTTRRDGCFSTVQAQRGCDLTIPSHQSQRVVLALSLDDALYCLNDFDAFLLDEAAGFQAQVCSQYIPLVCLSAFVDERTGLYDPYYSGNVICRDVETARDCIQASLTRTINVYGQEYSMPCRYHPNGAGLFAKLDAVLSTLLPCFPQASAKNSTVATITSIAMPSTSTTFATKNSSASAVTTRQASVATATIVVRSTTSTYAPSNMWKNTFWFSMRSSASTYPCNTLMMMHIVAVTMSLYFLPYSRLK